MQTTSQKSSHASALEPAQDSSLLPQVATRSARHESHVRPAGRSARRAVRRTSFGHFAPVAPEVERSSTALPGQFALDDAQQALRLFDPRDTPRALPERRAARDVGEQLPPLVPPVISAGTPAGAGRLADHPALGRSTGRRSVGSASVPDVRPARQSAAAPRTNARRGLRLTLRGRILVVMFVAAAIAGVSALAGPEVPSAELAVTSAQLVEFEVHEGDTVASIAQQVGGNDVAATIEAIDSVNGLHVAPDAVLEPGSIVLVPAR